jgi:hypothetical protein
MPVTVALTRSRDASRNVMARLACRWRGDRLDATCVKRRRRLPSPAPWCYPQSPKSARSGLPEG